MPEGVLVALGGNAILDPSAGPGASFETQRRRLAAALLGVAELARRGHPLVVVHGNGPQVGNALIRVEAARGRAYALPLDACVAQTQGEMGYAITQALETLLGGGGPPVACLLTRVVVDPLDPELLEPRKPIGPVYSTEPFREFPTVRDPRGGVRRVVGSPRPLRVVETETVRALLASGRVVVAAGGGGIPVTERAQGFRGVEAVVDKDRTAARLAADLRIPRLLNLTSVECVKTGYGTEGERDLATLTVSEARRLLALGEFAAGSMGPKVEGALDFLDRGGRRVDVTTPPRALEAFDGGCGTRILADPVAVA